MSKKPQGWCRTPPPGQDRVKVNQIFTGENEKQTNKQKKQVEFFTFFEVYTVRAFSVEFFLVYGSIFGSTVIHTLQKI